MPSLGLEDPPKTPGKTDISKQGGAECGARSALSTTKYPDLQRVIEVWADLPEAVRAGINTMVAAVGKTNESEKHS